MKRVYTDGFRDSAGRPNQKEDQARKARPDFLARLRAIYGNKVLRVSGAQLISWDRNRY